MTVKVTKGQICDGTISKNKYTICGAKFHTFMKKVHNFANFGGCAAILPTLLNYVVNFICSSFVFWCYLTCVISII